MNYATVAQDVIPENRLYYTGDNYYYWGIPSLNSDQKYSLQLNHTGYSGLRKVINSSFINGMYTGWMDKKGIALGASVLNDQQGDFINFAQFKANTAYKLRFSEKSYTIFSISMGFANLSLAGSTISGGGGSAIKPDVSAGNWLVVNKFKWGFSFDHLVNSEFTPIASRFSYNRKLVSLWVYDTEIIKWQCRNKISLLTAYYLFDKKKLFNLTEEFTYQKKFKLILNTVDLDLIGYGAGLNLNESGRGKFSLNFVFYSALNQKVVSSNKYELMLGFGFK